MDQHQGYIRALTCAREALQAIRAAQDPYLDAEVVADDELVELFEELADAFEALDGYSSFAPVAVAS